MDRREQPATRMIGISAIDPEVLLPVWRGMEANPTLTHASRNVRSLDVMPSSHMPARARLSEALKRLIFPSFPVCDPSPCPTRASHCFSIIPADVVSLFFDNHHHHHRPLRVVRLHSSLLTDYSSTCGVHHGKYPEYFARGLHRRTSQ